VSQFARHVLIAVLVVAGLMQRPAATEQQSTPPQQSGQPQPKQPSQPPRFRTEANLVLVDVYASKDETPVQDLKAEDFEILEDNAPQKISSFEHIVVMPAGPADTLVEPSSVTAANQLVADPRRRVFVIYLDNQQVSLTGSHNIKEPLIELMTRMMGADDLVGVMTPEMSPSQITFGRRTQVIEEGLRTNWYWGRRDSIMLNEREKLYDSCYPPTKDGESIPSVLARKMIARYRERLVLDSLQDLILHMGAAREGRTAVITVSEGWALFKPDPSMTELRTDSKGNQVDPIPGAPPPVGVGRGGTLTRHLPSVDGYGTSDRTECEKERADLALVDNETTFRNLFGDANRNNVSFYTIDPRGLAAVDLGLANPTVPQDTTWELLRRRIETLHTLALNTDGIALVNNNDLRKQIRRVADDLTSYYLIGYYSTNGKLDGKFRNIRVRSKRPGLEVRSRKGYTAATAAEVEKARTSASAPIPDTKVALANALGSIESDARAVGRKTTRGTGEPAIFHRGPATGNQVQPAPGRVFPRSERIRMEMEADAGTPVWTGVLLDRNGAATIVPVTTGERTDAATGQRWLTADITLAPLGAADYVVELTTSMGGQQKKTLVAIRVTQ
jgi:VWFA-related protein